MGANSANMGGLGVLGGLGENADGEVMGEAADGRREHGCELREHTGGHGLTRMDTDGRGGQSDGANLWWRE